jgi:hypothetical protein
LGDEPLFTVSQHFEYSVKTLTKCQLLMIRSDELRKIPFQFQSWLAQVN